MIVAECKDPAASEYYEGSKILTPALAYKAVPTRCAVVVTADPASSMIFNKAGTVVYYNEGSDRGMLIAGKRYAILHESQVAAWTTCATVERSQMTAEEIADMVQALDAQRSNLRIANGG